jgi:hypothetical protein
MSALVDTIWKSGTEEQARRSCRRGDVAFERSISSCTLSQKIHYTAWHQADPELTFADMCAFEEELRQADLQAEWEEHMADDDKWKEPIPYEEGNEGQYLRYLDEIFEEGLAGCTERERTHFLAWREREPMTPLYEMKWIQTRIVSGEPLLFVHEEEARAFWRSLDTTAQEPELVAKAASRRQARLEIDPREWDLLAAEIAAAVQ